MDNVTEKLLECFGHRKFKSELQERAVRAIARGKFSVHNVICRKMHLKITRNNLMLLNLDDHGLKDMLCQRVVQ